MGRPKGSKNKPKVELVKHNNHNYGIKISLEKQIENTPTIRNSMRGWINWGVRNDYPQRLSDLYYSSPTLKACVEFSATAVLGGGVDYEAMKIDGTQNQPNYQTTWDEFIYNLALDYSLYGTYAFQVIKNRDGKSYSFYHQSVADIRSGEADEDGVVTDYWISKDWTALAKYPPVNIKRFGFQDDEKIAMGEAYLFVFEKYCPDLIYYPAPRWIAALKPAQTEAELINFDLKSTLNSFVANGILTLNHVDSDEERNVIIDNISAMFQGSDNANSLIINFRNNDDEEPAVFTPLNKDVNNVDLFSENNNRTIDRIVSSFSIPSKMLIGITKEGASLGGDGNEMKVAYNIYNNLVGNKVRRDVVVTLNKALKLNGIDVEISLKPLVFGFDTDDTTDNTDISENKSVNIEEKITNEETYR